MKKLTMTIVGLLVAGLWFLPDQSANAQGDYQSIEQEIAQAEFEITLCNARIERAQAGLKLVDSGPAGVPYLVDPEERYPVEERIARAKECIAQAERRLKDLREKLAKLPPLPSSETPTPPQPPLDPKRKELLDAIAEVQRLSAEYGKKLNIVEKRAKRLPAKPGFTVKGESSDGILIGTITTPYGNVRVYLANDWRAGDVTTTTIKLEPYGKTEEERSPNLSKLTKMSIEYRPQSYFRTTDVPGEDKLPEGVEMVMPGDNVAMEVELISPIAMEKGLRWAIPERGRIETVNLILKGEDGEEKAGFGVPVGQKENNPASPKTPDNGFPKVIQEGRPAEIKLPTDGDASTTAVTIGGKPAQVLAESPRKIVVRCPDGVTGLAEIKVNEGNVETKGTTRIVGVALSAPKTNLRKGEQTTLTVEVTGLEGIKKDVPLQLDAKGVIQMDGGNSQNVRIRPQDVQGGRYITTREITGQQAGGFTVTGTVLHRVLIPLKENAKENGFQVRKDGYVIENVKDPLTGDLLDGEYALEYRCVPGTLINSPIPVLVKKGRAELKSLCSPMSLVDRADVSRKLAQRPIRLAVRFEF